MRLAVETPRDTVTAEKLVHCTNAYAASLLSQVRNFVTPNKAQAYAVVPTDAFSGTGVMESTMSLRYSMHHFYSLIQRQGDGVFILGVSRANPKLSQQAETISLDDSACNQEIVGDAPSQFNVMFPESTNEGVAKA